MKEILSITLVVDDNIDVIEECLESIINQDNQAYEVIIIDNMSSDGSFKVLIEYMQRFIDIGVYCRVIRNRRKYETNFNAAAAFGPTIGDYTIQITPEMRLPSDFVSKVLNIIVQKRPGAIVLVQQKDICDEQGKIIDFSLELGQIVENRLSRSKVGKYRESFLNYRATYRGFLFSVIEEIEVVQMDLGIADAKTLDMDVLKVLEKYRLLLACKNVANNYSIDIRGLLEKKYAEIKKQCIDYSYHMQEQGNTVEAVRYKELAKLF